MIKTTISDPVVTERSYVEWGAVFAGAVTALAITAVLVPFGNSIGLSLNATLTDENARGMIFGIGLWVFWTQLISSIVGGYIAGRSTTAKLGSLGHEGDFRDGAHGLLSWAFATVITSMAVAFIALLAPATTAAEVPSEEIARQASVVFGFTVTATAIVSAVAAWILGSIGGDHRDKRLDLSNHLSFRGK